MSRESALAADEVLDAVRSLLATDGLARPPHAAGWRANTEPSDAEPGADDGRSAFDPQTWRWFELVDLAYLDELVVVEFRWNEPSTPPLRYLLHCSIEGLPSAHDAAVVVRTILRRQLEPGWRERLGHHWLGHDRVVVLTGSSSEQQLRDSARW